MQNAGGLGFELGIGIKEEGQKLPHLSPRSVALRELDVILILATFDIELTESLWFAERLEVRNSDSSSK